MRIAKLKVPLSETEKVNLKEIDLSKKSLGSVVALVGKNGAGKSRILKFVENYFETVEIDTIDSDFLIQVPQIFFDNLLNINNTEELDKTVPNNYLKIILSKVSESNKHKLIFNLKNLGPAYIKVVNSDDFQMVTNKNIDNKVSFKSIINNYHFEKSNILANLNSKDQFISATFNEFSILNDQSTLDYLTKIGTNIASCRFQLSIVNENSPELIIAELKKDQNYIQFEKFQTYVTLFLGKNITHKHIVEGNQINTSLCFNGESFNFNLLSPGQKTLFAYAVLFYLKDVNSETSIKESIIIIDEPEKNLHPEAQIALIDALRKIIEEKGQLWIATHSVHILSHLNYDEIYLVQDDEIITPSRTTPGNSFNDLMGMENHVQELKTFIGSISEWAYANFMFQCFKEPDVIFGKDKNDPQYTLFKDFLKGKSKIKILDYGAGKGRIGRTINEDDQVSDKIDYFAFEPCLQTEELKSVKNIKGIYLETGDIQKNIFDIVILCNVLHEINPNEWLKVFETIKNSLNDTGYLIILEDKYLPKGEKIDEFGYLILGTEEMKILLDTDKSIEIKSENKNHKERLVFNAFIKNQINPSENTIISAIKKLNNNSFEEIKKLRKETESLDQGRKYANATQLYVNSTLALESLEKELVLRQYNEILTY